MLIKNNKVNKNKKNNVKSKLKNLFFKNIIKSSVFICYTIVLTVVVVNISEPTRRKLIEAKIQSSLPAEVEYELKKVRFIKHPISWVKGVISPSEKLVLDINFKNIKKLEKKRDEALKLGILIADDRDFVNTKISNKDENVKAKIRIKGDWPTHFNHKKKWSFRVKVSDGKTIMGMNKFSLHTPPKRHNLWEWVYHELLKEEGLPTIKYNFVNLILNGENLGVYAIEQHFEKILLESNNFKEGPILRLSEDVMWDYIGQSKKYNIPAIYSPNESFYNTEPKVFKEKKTLSNEVLKNQFQKASQLLSGFHTGELNTSEVFAIEPLARFFAISDLMNSWHSTRWHNQRFYYDPTSSLLVPIGFDGMGGSKKGEIAPLYLSSYKFLAGEDNELAYFNDPEFVKSYISTLERISNSSYLDNFFQKINYKLNYNANVVRKSFPEVSIKKIKDNLYKHQKVIKAHLNPASDPIKVFLQKYSDKYVTLSIGNNQHLPIEVIAIKENDKELVKLVDSVYINSKRKNNYINYKEFNFKLKNNNIKDLNNLNIEYKISGSSKVRTRKIAPFSRLENIQAKNDPIRTESKLDNFEFIIHDRKDRSITFKTGNWYLNKQLIIPANYKVYAGNGFNINLLENGLIFSKSPITFIGNYIQPIKITGEGNKNGLVVVNANKQSTLENVIFENLSTPQSNSWSTSGSVSFYQSPVKISNCKFINNNSEDSLNIVRSDFSIKDSHFINAKSDAIDIDFSNGEIYNTKISHTGNDGLDISGSKIFANKLIIKNIGDKAISVGEASNLNAKDVFISKSSIGIASKDKSILKGNNFLIKNSDIGLTVFRKKYEYGPAKISLENFKSNSISQFFLLANGSSLSINGKSYQSNSTNEYVNNKFYK